MTSQRFYARDLVPRTYARILKPRVYTRPVAQRSVKDKVIFKSKRA